MRIFHKIVKEKYPIFEMTLRGNSIPEDAQEYYEPFCDRLESFCNSGFGKKHISFTFNFKLDYYNSSSAGYITRIFFILKPLVKKGYVTINWYYFYRDEDIKEMGEDYIEAINIKMNMIKLKK